ncbi:MAG: V-type ATP synthase subunit I [Thermoclostridium sp.]|nr:V-type ATP synthase subunit I [Thermoclostridium sp.]
MKYVKIVGPIDQMDQFILHYVIDGNIQLEHAFNHVRNLKGLTPFMGENPFDLIVKTLENLNKDMKASVQPCCIEERCSYALKPIDTQMAMKGLEALEEKLGRFEKELAKTQEEIDENKQILKQLIPLKDLEFRMDALFHLEYMKFRFGKLPKESFEKMEMVLHSQAVIVVPISSDDRDVWVSCFMPAVVSVKIDNILSSFYFERIRISGKVQGYPADEIVSMEREIQKLEADKLRLQEERRNIIEAESLEFGKTYSQAIYMQQAYNARKFAAHTEETFYLTGWMPVKAYEELAAQLKQMEEFTLSAEEPQEVRDLNPPTILRNNRFFRPFEAIVTMYGMPAHNEFDPTVLIAITYILMFGAMFGDVGQGAVIALAGLYMFFGRKSRLGWVLACVGVSSVLFGFLYGSFFGNEHILKAVWKAPMENITQMLILAVGYGAVIIVLSIVINIINSIKAKDYGRLIFDRNGLAGLVFYAGALTAVLVSLSGKALPVPLVAVVLLVPLLAMLFKEKLERLLLKKHHDHGGSFVEGFFEVFESVLGFLSNTVSFVRVSAFALSHAGLSLAIWTLYGMAGGVGGKIVVLIIGNLLIIGLEGLIVGIQCMRLQFYEMFSRFFSGDGREFKPIRVCGKTGRQ